MIRLYQKIIVVASLSLLSASCEGLALNLGHQTSKAETQGGESEQHYTKVVKVADTTLVHVDLANTAITRNKGLAGRITMEADQGMLFDFTDVKDKKPAFWMKGMHFPLDLIWIRQGAVIGITPNVPIPTPGEKLIPFYYPPGPIDQVLEVQAGWSKRHGLTQGDTIILQQNP